MQTASSLRFRVGHATHPDWRMATELCLAQVEGQARLAGYERRATLGFVYFTDVFAAHIDEILDVLKTRTGVFDWTGTCGLGVIASGAEYMDEPALAVMLGYFPPGSAQVFSGVIRPPGLDQRTASGAWAADAALVHADPETADLADLFGDMAGKLHSRYLFGGLSSGRSGTVQVANRSLSGGLSGVVFSAEVQRVTRVSQACQPLGPVHVVTRGQGNLIALLDDRPALDVLLDDCGRRQTVSAARPGAGSVAGQDAGKDAAKAGGTTGGKDHPDGERAALLRVVRNTLCGLLPEAEAGKPVQWGEAEVRPLIGVDPHNRILAIGDHVAVGTRLQFCTRDRQAARLDLVRACSELREACEQQAGGLAAVRGALYISCVGRGSALFGRDAAEPEIIRQQLGDLPLVGFFANGEIAGRRLYGYTGVLTLFL